MLVFPRYVGAKCSSTLNPNLPQTAFNTCYLISYGMLGLLPITVSPTSQKGKPLIHTVPYVQIL